MEDFILREIDRLGEMLLMIARRIGLLDDSTPDYTLTDLKEEFDKSDLPFDLDAVLAQDNPVWYLVEQENLTDHALETLIFMLFHSDLDESVKAALLDDAVTYLDGKGFYSVRLHSLITER